MKKQHRIAPEVKEQISKRIREDGISVEIAAKDVGEVHHLVWSYNHTRIHTVLKMPPLFFALRYRKLVEKNS